MLRAAQVVLEEGLAHPILIGRPHVIDVRLKRYGLRIKPGTDFTLINPEDDPRYRDYVDLLIELAGRRGVTQEAARTSVRTDVTVIAALALKRGDADAMICGLEGRFERHLRNVNLIIGARPGVRDRDLSALSMLIWQRGVTFFTDTYVTVDPSAEEIAEMTVLAAEEITRFGIEPKAALLSHSNFGSRDSPSALKMREAAAILKRVAPQLACDGEMHGDSALSEILRNRVYPHSDLKGEANLLVFPDLDSANIAMTIAKTMLDALHVGPILLGTDKPAHISDALGDLARHRQHDGAGRGRSLAEGAGSHAGRMNADAPAGRESAHIVNQRLTSPGSKWRQEIDERPIWPEDAMRRIGQMAWHAAALAAGAVALIALLAAPASAKAAVCRQLEAELASIGGGGGGGSAQVKRYDRAVAEQRDQLSTARSRARRAGCGFFFLAIGPAMCAPLNAQIERMERNLEALERKRVALSGGGGSRRDRARILAALDANNCSDIEVAEREPPRRNGPGLFDRLFGREVPEGLPMDEPERQPFEQEPGEQQPIEQSGRQLVEGRPATVTRILNPNGEVSILGPAGEFATMCVRTCDGYYFPMSPDSSSADFDRDLKNCETSCPGTEMELYYQGAVGEEFGDDGLGRYRRALCVAADRLSLPRCDDVPAARLRLQSGRRIFPSSAESAQPVEPVEPLTPTPVVRPDPADDPETWANRQGGLDVETIKRILKPKPASRRSRRPASAGSGSSGQCSFPTQQGQ